MSDSPRKVVKLRKPIKLGDDELVEELAFRPLTGKDLLGLNGNEIEMTLKLAARLSGQIDEIIYRLEGDDLWEVMIIVEGFTTRPRARPSGSGQSES